MCAVDVAVADVFTALRLRNSLRLYCRCRPYYVFCVHAAVFGLAVVVVPAVVGSLLLLASLLMLAYLLLLTLLLLEGELFSTCCLFSLNLLDYQ